MLEQIKSFQKQIETAREIVGDFKVKEADKIKEIVIDGMGGSGMGGDLIKILFNDQIRIIVNKRYALPPRIGPQTLFFSSSYSGNTEETLATFKEAIKARAKVVAITSDGKLAEICQEMKYNLIVIPKNYQPRAALYLSFFSMLFVLVNSGIIKFDLKEVGKLVKALNNPRFTSLAEDLAKNLVNKIPLVYATPELAPAALRWKTQFNENTKIHAFYNVFSELNHNELMGYSQAAFSKFFHTIILRDEQANKRMFSRIKITKEIIKSKGVNVTEIKVTGASNMVCLFSAIYIGDLTSYYLAKEYGIDPVEVNLIKDLKEKLKSA